MKKIFAGASPEISEREKLNAKLALKIAEEGIVVLKNDGVLPLSEKRVALLGSGARRTVKGGTGSGSVNERHSISIEEGFIKAGFTVTTTDWLDRYDAFFDNYHKEWRDAREAEIVGITDIMEILARVAAVPFLYPTGVPVTEEDLKNAGDTAIYVIARQVGEGEDRANKEGEYKLSEIERKNIKFVAEHVKNVILVVNAGNSIEISEVEPFVKAIVFYGQAGQEGGYALANLMSGKVNPSGKLTFSWVKSYEDIPFGNQYGAMGNSHEQDYLEDIYVGYRYFDTFGVQPAFPFGFGLSYTQFEITDSVVEWDGKKFTVTGEVKNIGKREGKEVVQVYVSVPFGKDGAEYQRLVGFYKTPLLAAGGKCPYRVVFTVDDLTRFNKERAAFVLEEGSYLVRVGNSSQNTVPMCNVFVNGEVITEQCVNVCPQKKELTVLRAPKRVDEDVNGIQEIDVEAESIQTVTHVYEEPALVVSEEDKALLDTMPIEDMAKLVIGGGVYGKRIVEVFGASGSTTSDLYEKYGIPNAITLDGPGGLNVANKFSVNAQGDIMTLSIPPSYDFGVFGQHMRREIEKAVKDGETRYQYATAWPCSLLLAQTFNTELAGKFGEGIAVEMKEFGASVWLAPGMNIQKNPLCGRNFEYYSEDPLVSGIMSAATVNGVQKHGIAVSIKHFCCNNVERDRSTSSSNLTERALREIYLKGFRIAVENSAPMTVMTSYNLINGVYNCNNPELLVKVLRCEWGFDGLVMTDWSACAEGQGDAVKAVAAQNDLVMPGTPEEEKMICEAMKEGTLSHEELYRCAARTLALIRKTAAIEFKKV